jgi:predicted N-acyltransferase
MGDDSELLVRERLAEVPAAGWDGLAGPDDLYLTHRWLGVVEQTARTSMRYLVLARGGAPAAAMTTALATPEVPWVSGRIDHLLTEAARDGVPEAAGLLAGLPGGARALLPTLHCGGRHVGRSRVLHADGAGPAARPDVERLVAAAERLAVEANAVSVSFPYVDERDTALDEVLRERGYRCFPSGRDHWLPVDGRGFPAYLRSLPRSRRNAVLRDRRKVADAGLVVTVEPLTDAVVDRLAELEVALLAKYGLSWPVERSADALRTAAAEFGDDASVVLGRAGGDVRGFVLLLRHRDQWYLRQCGFDHAYLGKVPLYFELLFYHLVTRAPVAGVSAIQYGVGSEEAKVSRGCHASQLRCYLLPLRTGGARA